jgi:hypothetical protein
MFVSVNENFISAVVEDALMMASQSIDISALQDAAAGVGLTFYTWNGTCGGLLAWFRRNGGVPSAMTMSWLLFT